VLGLLRPLGYQGRRKVAKHFDDPHPNLKSFRKMFKQLFATTANLQEMVFDLEPFVSSISVSARIYQNTKGHYGRALHTTFARSI
jgi:hypothetical protein